ncbi:alpha/beta hydrolase [Hymenobacter sp. HMF4947]|uniref:Alpha/beta hydrolase n=2 Tax=Hymenobacter ginkgonis TaxID=2682976 RepID=A0A7K1TB44_9BACT|nr:alpha/beta hydrolase [Hymenobacter ginkgonis]
MACARPAHAQTVAVPLAIGQTFTLSSAVLGETRRINVYMPPGYPDSATARLPVLYMLDGGLREDFLHVAGLVQVATGNGTMRPFLLVGIENTERRRDLTGPTTNPEDQKIAPRVGGSAAFRTFLRTELLPTIRQRYRTTAESAIIGESLAGLFVLETFLQEPDLFDTYLAFDPSLWWNKGHLVDQAAPLLRAYTGPAKTVYVASSSDDVKIPESRRWAPALQSAAKRNITWYYKPMPAETHATIYHPAALQAFRIVFKPTPAAPAK